MKSKITRYVLLVLAITLIQALGGMLTPLEIKMSRKVDGVFVHKFVTLPGDIANLSERKTREIMSAINRRQKELTQQEQKDFAEIGRLVTFSSLLSDHIKRLRRSSR